MANFIFTTENAERVFNAFIEERKDLRELAEAVVGQMGDADDPDVLSVLSEVMDARNGVGGFIYYSETCDFFRKNRALILSQLHDDADNFGSDMLRMCTEFDCFVGIEYDEIARALYCADEDGDEWITLANGFAWYAYETIAHAFYDFLYSYDEDEDEDEEEENE